MGGIAIKKSSKIPYECAEDTAHKVSDIIEKELKVKTKILGSIGKKKKGDASGDIDLAYKKEFNDNNVNDVKKFLVKKFGDDVEINVLKGFNIVSFGYPYEYEGKKLIAQVDLMFGENVDFTEFMNWSPDLSKGESQFKGLFRTDFIRCLTNTKPLPDKYKPVKDKNGNVLEYYYYALDVKHGGLVIKHKSFKGKKVGLLKNAKTLDDVVVIKDANKSIESMIKYIFGKNITMDDVNSFESVVEYVKKNIDMEWRTEAIKRFKEEEDRKNTKNRNNAYKILQGII